MPEEVTDRKNRSDALLQRDLENQLGQGPMRFGPVRLACAIEFGVASRGLSEAQRAKFVKIKRSWERAYKKDCAEKLYTDCEILRIAFYCDFNRRRTLAFMKTMEARLFRLSIADLGGQIRTRTLFPCPGLKTKEGCNIMYMRPSRFYPDETPIPLIIDNLVYVMDKMKRKNPKSGIALLANMEGWTMTNFSMEYCRKFMSVIQGNDFPVQVSQFLILNPPNWFGNVWAIMKTMLSAKFRERVAIIKGDNIFFSLTGDFEDYLPDEVRGGEVDTGNLVRDFVIFQQAVEQAVPHTKQPEVAFARGPLIGFAMRKRKIEAASTFSAHGGASVTQRSDNDSTGL